MPLVIVRNDITKLQVDIMVNAANTHLKQGGGVCGAIFHAAGVKELQKACNVIGECQVGKAVITDGFQLPADHIIHTVGPIWQGGTHQEEKLLKGCYEKTLQLALQYQCKSIAFPLISTGNYGYPKDQALQIATSSISEFLKHHEMLIYLVVFDNSSFKISEQLFHSVEAYIDEHYVEEKLFSRRMNEQQVFSEPIYEDMNVQDNIYSNLPLDLETIVNQLDESFSKRLFQLIDEKGMTDVETYKKANIDRRLFSKIRNSKDYTPHKRTVLAFAIALELSLDATNDLLFAAGYSLSRSYKFDVIIEYFIKIGNYNIFEINEALFAFDQNLLGA